MSLPGTALFSPVTRLFTSMGIGSLTLNDLTSIYAPAGSGSAFVELDGCNVHYRDQGDRELPVIIMIHGVVSSLHTWDDWFFEFNPHYRVIRFDLPGFGLTGPSKDGVYTVERMLRILGLLMDHLHVERASFAGSSLGGYLAWNFALSQPNRVEKLVLIDPAGYAMDKLPWMIAASQLPGSTILMPIWMPRTLIAQGVKEVYGDRKRIKASVVERYYRLSRRPGNRRAMMQIFRQLVLTNRTQLLQTPAAVARLEVPTLLLWGEVDRWIPPAQVRLWQRDLPSIQVKTYPGVGHLPMEEIPWQSAADALQFLQAGDCTA
ncbi:alpha/beta fold hydrolase [Pseudomonas segetis]|uniref:Pimeloyl-ACP methyl ester carboxylesterase n=1 Tax=Pseudomonas segetis TaxID=298908 RepID=A0A239CPD6_9PSED|nr:alpha/beta hydrolase [Pseudomonas segetis]SNS22015.1 Pimeloyl-ACP methyl ester carboxylesterase [Pseudomonas segetis]